MPEKTNLSIYLNIYKLEMFIFATMFHLEQKHGSNRNSQTTQYKKNSGQIGHHQGIAGEYFTSFGKRYQGKNE